MLCLIFSPKALFKAGKSNKGDCFFLKKNTKSFTNANRLRWLTPIFVSSMQ